MIPRLAHRLYATVFGYFWVPCRTCGAYFGGHEWRDRDGHIAELPTDSTGHSGVAICPACTRLGVGCRARYPIRVHVGCEYLPSHGFRPGPQSEGA